MISRFRTDVILGAIVVSLLAACGKPSPPPPPVAKVTSKKVAVELPPTFVVKPDEPPFIYNPVGKKDPFKSLMVVMPLADADRPRSPLQQYALDQLRIIGVVWGWGEPKAMVVTPDGKSYVLRKGIKVGKNEGTVLGITRDHIVVEERYYELNGDVRTASQKIPIPANKKEPI